MTDSLLIFFSIMFIFKRVIGFGASQIIVPGIFPMGCLPAFPRDFKSTDRSAYDKHQCLNSFNDFIAFHNDYLQKTIITLQEEHPHTTIVYSDYYSAFEWILSNAQQLGKYNPSHLVFFMMDMYLR